MKRAVFATTLAVALAAPALAATPPQSDQEKTIYAVGLAVSRSLSVFHLTPQELELVQQGLKDGLGRKQTVVELEEYQPKIQQLARERRKEQGEKLAAAGKAFLDKAAAEKGAVRTETGMVYLSLAEGTGAAPKSNDTVKVHYRGRLIDGEEFDSSYRRGKALEFKLDNVIKCWTEGVQRMKAGGKARLVCPPETAYGDHGVADKIMPGATLDFEVELLEVKKATAPPAPLAPSTKAGGSVAGTAGKAQAANASKAAKDVQ